LSKAEYLGGESVPRPKRNTDGVLPFQPSTLKLTNQYHAMYEAIDEGLRKNPRIVDLAHRDLKEVDTGGEHAGDSEYRYATDTILRVIIAQRIEDLSLRGIVIRIDDSTFLRRFTRIHHGPMMDYTTLCRLRNAIKESTWRKINQSLAEFAVEQALISGDSLRLDTTAVETNIHYPTDSTLLWDVTRTLGRLIGEARDLDRRVVGSRRLHLRCIRRRVLRITRKAAKKGRTAASLKPLYKRLLVQVEGVLDLASDVAGRLRGKFDPHSSDSPTGAWAEALVVQMVHSVDLGRNVVDQTRRRVLEEEKVPNDEKLFSIFEEHTELLKRGKAGKDIEFGHMIQIQQVEEKFITDYTVFDKKPVEHQLLDPALRSHRKLFGEDPQQLTADKGYYEGMDAIRKLEERVPTVAIGKKGRRNIDETLRELDPVFRHAQRFRAGVEGTISFLKRCLGLFRIVRKGWGRFETAVGESVFVHNLLILARC
jgi:IS5 family transposase